MDRLIIHDERANMNNTSGRDNPMSLTTMLNDNQGASNSVETVRSNSPEALQSMERLIIRERLPSMETDRSSIYYSSPPATPTFQDDRRYSSVSLASTTSGQSTPSLLPPCQSLPGYFACDYRLSAPSSRNSTPPYEDPSPQYESRLHSSSQRLPFRAHPLPSHSPGRDRRSTRSPSSNVSSNYPLSTPVARGRTREYHGRAIKPRANSPHNNKKYTDEQVHRIRYEKVDLNRTYQYIHEHWSTWFPAPEEKRKTPACINSRIYRNNYLPVLDAAGNIVVGKDGKVVMRSHKVRGRNTPEGKDLPFTLVEMHPVLCLIYPWVLPEHKMAAQSIIDEVNSGRPHTKKLKIIAAMIKLDLEEVGKMAARRMSTSLPVTPYQAPPRLQHTQHMYNEQSRL